MLTPKKPMMLYLTSWIYFINVGTVVISLVYFIVYSEVTHLGPPFVPIFRQPSITPPPVRKFWFGLTIECPTDTVALHLTQAKLTLADNTTFQPFVKAEKRFMEGSRLVRGYESIPLQTVIVSNGVMKYTVEFSPFESEPEEFTVELGALQINGQNVNLPPLKFHKVFRHRYQPIGPRH